MTPGSDPAGVAAGSETARAGAERVAALLDERPPVAPRLRAALRLVLTGRRHAIRDLVRETGLSRRFLLDLLHRMDGDLAWDGDVVRFAGGPAGYARLATAGAAGAGGVTGPPSGGPPAAAVERMRRILERVPPAVRSLDHVPATAETVLRRALYIAHEFDLGRIRLLFAGDHDCTSLAFGVLGLRPHSVTVIDIDERLLAFIGGEAAASGAPVTPLFADLRIGLPPGARGAHDVVFTDPPYTADGIGLFAARGVESLADPVNGQILLAYGYPESAPALGLKVQRALGELDLLFAAILPGFNRYEGAEAIGSRADLYRLRPTTRTAAIAQRVIARHAKTLYTQGSQAEESAGEPARGAAALPDAVAGDSSDADVVNGAGGGVARAVLDRFGRSTEHDRASGPLLVGAGWPVPGAMPAERFLGSGKPPPGGATTVLVDLRPLFGWSLIRAGLVAAGDRVIMIAPMDAYGLRSEAEQALLRAAVTPKYEVERVLRPFTACAPASSASSATAPDGTSARIATPAGTGARAAADAAVVVFRRQQRRDPISGYVWDRPHGRIGNTWREGLIAAARDRGVSLTRNEARALIGDADLPPGIVAHRLIDLPASALGRLAAVLDETGMRALRR